MAALTTAGNHVHLLLGSIILSLCSHRSVAIDQSKFHVKASGPGQIHVDTPAGDTISSPDRSRIVYTKTRHCSFVSSEHPRTRPRSHRTRMQIYTQMCKPFGVACKLCEHSQCVPLVAYMPVARCFASCVNWPTQTTSRASFNALLNSAHAHVVTMT